MTGGKLSERREIISVIVPVYQQWDRVEVFLRHWRNKIAGRRGAELIIVDNDLTFRSEKGVLPDDVKLVECSQVGAYAARNAGASAASGSWLVFADADCRPDPNWLVELEGPMAEGDDAILAGGIRMVLEPPRSRYAIYDFLRGIPQARYAARGYGATANLAVAADLFRHMGGFDPHRLSGGDAEFCRRSKAELGTSVRFVPEAVVVHPARASWDELRTKARRVKGGQLTRGSWSRRLYWVIRTSLPPLHEVIFLLQAPHSLAMRLTATTVRLQLWGVELKEMVRLLLLGGAPERR